MSDPDHDRYDELWDRLVDASHLADERKEQIKELQEQVEDTQFEVDVLRFICFALAVSYVVTVVVMLIMWATR